MNQLEQLESRCLMSATAGLPSLTGVLSVKKTTITAPGQQVTATLKVTNSGGDISKTTVPIGIYAGDNLVATLLPSLTLKNGQTKTIPIKVTIPAGDTLPLGNFNFSALINDGNFISEVPSTNGNASTTLFNPVGTYTGTYQVGSAPENLDISIFTSGGKFESNVTANGQTFGNISATNAKTTIAGNGKFSAVAAGSGNANGVSKFVVHIKGTINTSTDTISGPFAFNGKSNGGPFKGHGTFSVTEQITG